MKNVCPLSQSCAVILAGTSGRYCQLDSKNYQEQRVAPALLEWWVKNTPLDGKWDGGVLQGLSCAPLQSVEKKENL